MAQLPKSIKLTEQEVSQKINLKEEFGIDPGRNPQLADRIGQALIDKIVDRTLRSRDIHGESFDKYDPSYKESDSYQAYGKTSKVNMQLTGNMLGQLTVKEVDNEGVELGWNDTTQNAKAYNHMKGDTVTKREFFGVTDEEIKKVKSELSTAIDEAKQIEEVSDTRTAFDLLKLAGGTRRLTNRTGELRATEAFLDSLDNGLF